MSLLLFLACSMSASTPPAAEVSSTATTSGTTAPSSIAEVGGPTGTATAPSTGASTAALAPDSAARPLTKAKEAPAELPARYEPAAAGLAAPVDAAPLPATEEYERADDGLVAASGGAATRTSALAGDAPSRRESRADRDERSYATSRGYSPPPVQVAPLRAGATDDNADFNAYLSFLGSWTDRGGMRGQYQSLNVSSRKQLLVVDAKGRPIPGAEVTVTPTSGQLVASRSQDLRGGSVWSGTTYGDGRLAFYPGLSDAPGASDYSVTVRADGAVARAAWGGGDDLTVRLDTVHPAPQAVPVDVVFVVDTTGSMGDEIARIKETLLSTTARIRGLDTPVDLRYGAVYYRDHGDAYVTRSEPLSADIRGFDRQLHTIDAGGGGDYPEAMNEGLRAAVTGMEWRPGAAKVAFLIADAPPHMDYSQDIPYGDTAEEALRAGIRVHTVAASGLDEIGTLAFRQVAQLTRGQFIFIEYGGSSAATAASHGVGGQFESNNLDQILYGRIRDEVVAYGR